MHFEGEAKAIARFPLLKRISHVPQSAGIMWIISCGFFLFL